MKTIIKTITLMAVAYATALSADAETYYLGHIYQRKYCDGTQVSERDMGAPWEYTVLTNPSMTGYDWDRTEIRRSAISASGTLQQVYTSTPYSVNPDSEALIYECQYFTAKKFTVSYDGNGSSSGSTQPSSFTYNQPGTIAVNGFTREFTVTFDADGGTAEWASTNVVSSFLNWADTPTGTATYTYTSGQTEMNPCGSTGEDVMLYARWQDGYITLPNASRAGYVLEGWYATVLGASGRVRVGGAGDKVGPVSTNVTLYATWVAIAAHIEYENYGTFGPFHPIIMGYGQSIKVSKPTKEGRSFAGWQVTAGLNTETAQYSIDSGATWLSLSSDEMKVGAGCETVYFKNLTTEQGGIVTLYANWLTPDDDCVTFTSEGGFTLKTANLKKNWDEWLEWSTNKIVWVEWNGEEIRAATTGDMGNYNLYVRGSAPGPLPDQVNTVITGLGDEKKWVLTPAGENKVACLGNIETLRGAKGETPSPAPMRQFCYWGMFQDCPSLISAPELPAETLAANCYARMFNGCVSLTSAPELPAMTLATSCYERMFSDCTSLTSAPTLLATNLAAYCYRGMFQRCTEITNVQEALPAMTLSAGCYQSMFVECDSLTNAPELPATNLANSCYFAMFIGCTSLHASPDLPATELAGQCYYSMFQGCASLTTAPKILPATNLADMCYLCMFDRCSSLTNAPALPATKLVAYCYTGMFSFCTSLMDAPQLPAMTLAECCYSDMFVGCTSLKSAPVLPAVNLADYCYASMFCDCASLTQIPELSATNLASHCYFDMFYACTGIKISTTSPGKPWSIPADATTAEDWNAGMFAGTGDFTGDPEVGKTYYVGAEKTKLAGGFTARVYDGECTITGAGELTDASALKSKGVTNLVIGAGVTKVGDAAFRGWQSLLGVTLGEDCTALGAGAFKKCSYLNSVRGGANLASVGAKAFYFCLSLETISLDGTMPDGLADSIVIQTAVDSDGKPYLIPNISMAGYEQVLFGKKTLLDAEWTNLGSPDQDMQGTGYCFFQIRLVPKGE